MKKTAIISDCGRYRYRLTRGIGKLMPVVMLNPSTADANVDDPTVRRLLGFAQRGVRTEGRVSVRHTYDGIDVVNLYALRSKSPKDLVTATDPYGPDNDMHLRTFMAFYGARIIVAWGANASPDAVRRFYSLLTEFVYADHALSCFGTNKNGSPKHPLYIPNYQMLSPYYWWTP